MISLLVEDVRYLWCRKCERAYHPDDVRHVEGRELCAYNNCEGDSILDGRDWKAVKNQISPFSPDVPEFGKIYPRLET